ncbi:arginine-glutamic acid dipeptide repeats protein-like [Diaphorina citri]|uniref:Arginine-glutamic acid dipeptide repeats protein-like n=1 Tax=Diaphorina citri TaxID=121845 RepID=A0A3Q0IW76_DIACI|nr:arginine-glutamic acid dipeptide repeats protein-like [Diaphorina citri]
MSESAGANASSFEREGEIRIGPAHQARLPEYRPGSTLSPADLGPDPEMSKEREEIRWVPAMTLDGDLLVYLRAARSMAAFAGMCDGGSADDGCMAATRDDTTINALDVLHECSYDPGKALQALVKCPVPKGIEKKWCEEETKRFVKGLRQFGKNFFRIRKDLLPHKDVAELVEFYYLWKKTPGANNNRPHRRRRQGSLRRIRNTRNTRGGTPKEEPSARPSPNPKEQGEGSSGTEDEEEEDDSDSRDNSGFRCAHCFTTNSRDWQHATSGPKQGALLCSECRAYLKKYGELPPAVPNANNNKTDGTNPYLFPSGPDESPEGSPGRMRTRNKAKETPTKDKNNSGKKRSTPDNEMDKKIKSPGGSNSNSPSDKNKKKNKPETPSKSKKRALDEESGVENGTAKKKRGEGTESHSEETSESGSTADDTETNIPIETPPPTLVPEQETTDLKPNMETSADLSMKFSDSLQQEVKEEPEFNVKVDAKPKTEDPIFPGLGLGNNLNRPLEVTSGTALPSKPFDEAPPAPGKVTVKREGLFEIQENSNTMSENIIPKEENEQQVSPDTVDASGPHHVVSSQSPNSELLASTMPVQPVPPPLPEDPTLLTQSTIKQEPESEVIENNNLEENREQDMNPEPDTQSPMQLTTYSSQPRSPLATPPNKEPNMIYPPYSEAEKSALNLSSMSPSQPPQPFPQFYLPHFHPHRVDKRNSPPVFNAAAATNLQMEPQNLKIKQEVIAPELSAPSADPLQSRKVATPEKPEATKPPSRGPIETISSPFDRFNPRAAGYPDTPALRQLRSCATSTGLVHKARPHEQGGKDGTTMMTHHHSSSSVTTRMREEDAQEIMHHSSHHSSSVHHHSEHSKQTISHSTSSSATSVQHKMKRGTSPALSQAGLSHVASATLSQTTSSSVSTNHGPQSHSHHHQHSHHHHHQTATASPPASAGLSHVASATLSQTTSSSVSTNHGPQSHSHHHQHSHHHHHQTATASPPASAINARNSSSSSSSSVKNVPTVNSLNPLVGVPFALNSSLDALRAHALAAALHSPLPPHGMAAGHPAFLPPEMGGLPHGLGMPGVDSVKHEALTISGDEGSMQPEEEEIPSPPHHIPRGPSPEPKIEDSECHRSQSAIFLRHWNRGDYNSCCRTDLTFKPVPDSKLARKREERLRKQAEREREEREKAQAVSDAILFTFLWPDRNLILFKFTLSKYGVIAPGAPPGMHQFGLYPSPGGPSPAAALTQLERERLERLGIPAPGSQPPAPQGPGSNDRGGPGGGPPSSVPPSGGSGPSTPGSGSAPPVSQLEAERLALATDPMVRLQMAGINPEYHAHTHAHTHAHSHTHLHLHQGQQGAGGAQGAGSDPASTGPASAFPLPGGATGNPPVGAYPRPPSLLAGGPRDLHHPADLRAVGFAEQLAHQAVAHEHLQRQMMLERDRFPPHPSIVAQHEEYIRQQRERELKVRALEEAARGLQYLSQATNQIRDLPSSKWLWSMATVDYPFASVVPTFPPLHRLELEHLEREKREREIRELRERELNDRIKEDLIKNASLLPVCVRYGVIAPGAPPGMHQFGLYPSPGGPSPAAALTQLERERLERLGIPAPGSQPPAPQGPGSNDRGGPGGGPPSSVPPSGGSGPSTPGSGSAPPVSQLEAERLALATDPMVRLQMAGINPEYHAHTHAHTHAHSHTHLHLHQGQQGAGGAQGAGSDPASTGPASAFPLPGGATGNPPVGAYPRPPSLLAGGPRDLHHPADLRAVGFAEQLAHQAVAHEHLQRQMMLERDRFPPHPSIVAQHEEYIRQQRERELKVRALEEATFYFDVKLGVYFFGPSVNTPDRMVASPLYNCTELP